MTDPDHDLEQALRALRPAAPGPAVTARIDAELAPPVARRGVIIAWSAGFAAAAAALVAFVFVAEPAEPEAPAYQLVRAERTRPEVQLFRPVELADGSYARPVRVRWEDTTRWEDARTQTRLIDHRPNDRLAFLPLETN
ncbi:MAG: hypothetical protein FJ384_03265 [Verrucomicrobia bacterium]|nr:hypothetical protein [Verrucomicrobiota bacterium]